MDLFYTKSMELTYEHDASDRKSLLHIAMDVLFKRTKGQEPHSTQVIRKHVRIIRAFLRSGYPMYTLDYYKHMPINLLLQKDWNVSSEVISKVVKVHVESGFDVLYRPIDFSRK